MDGPAVFQVSHHGHLLPFQFAPLLLDGVEIEKGLGGVLARPVAAVEHRDLHRIGHDLGPADLGLSHHDAIHIALHRAGGIGQALTLGRRRAFRVRHGDGLGAQSLDCGLKGEPRPGGGLQKDHRHHLVRQEIGHMPSPAKLLHLGGHLHDFEDIPLAQILRGKDVPAFETHSSLPFLKSTG